MTTRITVHPEFNPGIGKNPRINHTRRNAWLAIFASSALFWGIVALMVWHLWGGI